MSLALALYLTGIVAAQAVAFLVGFVVAMRRLPKTLAAMSGEEWRALAGRVAARRGAVAVDEPPPPGSGRPVEDPEVERLRNERRQDAHDHAVAKIREAAMTRG